MYNPGLDNFIRVVDAGSSLYNDAKYIIQYSRESVARAKMANKNDE